MQAGKKTLTGSLRSRGIYLGLAGVHVSLVVLLTGLLLSERAHADSICGTLEECRALITQAQAKIKELQPTAQTKTSFTGSVFTRVNDHPELGEAWKDANGVTWGDIVKKDGSVFEMNQYDAFYYCQSIEARLPSRAQFAKLAEYLGAGSDSGYMPQILPNLRHWFWSSSVDRDYNAFASVFSGTSSFIGDGGRRLHHDGYTVRCVLQ